VRKGAYYYGRGIEGGERWVRRRYLYVDGEKEIDQNLRKNNSNRKRKAETREINGKRRRQRDVGFCYARN
jgi:hypothetical protein